MVWGIFPNSLSLGDLPGGAFGTYLLVCLLGSLFTYVTYYFDGFCQGLNVIGSILRFFNSNSGNGSECVSYEISSAYPTDRYCFVSGSFDFDYGELILDVFTLFRFCLLIFWNLLMRNFRTDFLFFIWFSFVPGAGIIFWNLLCDFPKCLIVYFETGLISSFNRSTFASLLILRCLRIRFVQAFPWGGASNFVINNGRGWNFVQVL